MRELLLRLFATTLPPHDVHGRSTIVQLPRGGAGATVWAATDEPVSPGPRRAPRRWGRPRWRWRSRRIWPLEVISADSRQVYRRLDIGTAKPTRKERRRGAAPWARPDQPGRALQRRPLCPGGRGLDRRRPGPGRLPVVVGGTGLYVRALAEGLFEQPAMDAERRRASRRGRPASIRSSWCAGPDASIRDSPGAAGSARSAPSRWRCSPVSRSRTWQREAKSAGAIVPWYVRLTRAAAGAAPADQAPGDADGAARADRGSGRGARGRRDGRVAGTRRHRRRGRRWSTSRGGDRDGGRGGDHHQHPAVRQAAGNLVPAPAAAARRSSGWTRRRPAGRLVAAEIAQLTGRRPT